MEGITAIESILETIETELPKDNMDILLKDVLDSMNRIILSYERKEQHEVENQIIVDVVPRFERLREEVERIMRYSRLS